MVFTSRKKEADAVRRSRRAHAVRVTRRMRMHMRILVSMARKSGLHIESWTWTDPAEGYVYVSQRHHRVLRRVYGDVLEEMNATARKIGAVLELRSSER